MTAIDEVGRSPQQRGISRRLLAPLLDRRGNFSLLKTATLACLIAPALWLAYGWHAGQLYFIPEVTLLISSGDWSTWFLLAALAITPLRRITGWSQLISIRRMIGLAGLAYAIAHLPFYFALRLWDVQMALDELLRRVSLILATLSLIGLCALGATSFDAAIRWMGERWNQLHDWVYALTGLAILHYLMAPDSIIAPAYVSAGLFVWLMAWRVLDRRHRLGASPPALVVLTMSTAIFTAVFQALWIWLFQTLYQGVVAPFGGDPWRNLAANFDLEWWQQSGVSPALQVLVTGLVVAAMAAGRGRVNDYGRRIGGALSKFIAAPLALGIAGIGLGIWLALMLLPAPVVEEALPDLGDFLGDSSAAPTETGYDVPRLLALLGGAAAGGAAGLTFGMAIDRTARRPRLDGGSAEPSL